MDVVTVIKIVRTAAAALEAARAFAVEAKAAMGSSDQAALQKELERLGAENDAGHARFQEQLADAATRGRKAKSAG